MKILLGNYNDRFGYFVFYYLEYLKFSIDVVHFKMQL